MCRTGLVQVVFDSEGHCKRALCEKCHCTRDENDSVAVVTFLSEISFIRLLRILFRVFFDKSLDFITMPP